MNLYNIWGSLSEMSDKKYWPFSWYSNFFRCTCRCHELGLFSLSFSLSRPGPACLFFPTCSSLQLALALLLCHTCSHFCLITFSLLLVSVSPCSLSDYFVCTWVMPVCYAIYMNIYLVLSCLIKSRAVVLVLCAFVSQSSCCMWPRTRTVFLPYEKLALLSILKTGVFLYWRVYLLCVCSGSVSLLDRLPVFILQ